MTNQRNRVAILVDDMFFAAKINSAAAECGSRIERVKSKQQLEDLASDLPSVIIVDLNSDRLSPIDAISFLKSHDELRTVPIVGFVSHVHGELIRQAQAAGCDRVIARSAFTHLLPRILAGDLDADNVR